MAKKNVQILRGEERIQQLQEAFPEIHRTLVVKTDLLRESIRPTAATRDIGRWALPEAPWYFEYSKEDVHTAEETADGYLLSPVVGGFSNGVSWMFTWNSKSPYEVRYEERGRYRLYRDGEPIEEIFFPPRPSWYDKKTSSGRPMASVNALRGEDFMFLVPLTYCEYFKDGNGCRYCNINPSESTKKDLGLERMKTKRDQDIYETFMAAAQESPIRSQNMSGGVILDSSKEADNYGRIVRVLRRAMKDARYEVPIGISCQAMGEEDQIKLKEAGVSSLNHNLEVWDPKLWEVICPGKAKYVGRERWIESILRAKEIFGRANTSMVLGVELAQPYGFKSEDEAAASVLEGWEWLMARGVSPGATFFRPVPGTEFAGMAPPRTEYLLRMSLAHYQLIVEYKLAPKPGKPPAFAGLNISMDLPHVPAREMPAAASSSVGSSGDVC